MNSLSNNKWWKKRKYEYSKKGEVYVEQRTWRLEK